MINYDNKTFRIVSNTSNGDTGENTLFVYHQDGPMIWATYSGGKIRKGHLIGSVDEEYRIHMVYHHLNTDQQIMTGKCISTPEILPDGRIRLHESWQWTNGKGDSGNSVIEEVSFKG